MSIAPIAAPPGHEDRWDEFVAAVRARFESACREIGAKPVLLVADVPDLYSRFLGELPDALRKEMACACCRAFIGRYGVLVTVAENGRVAPLLWDLEKVPAPYAAAVSVMVKAVSEAPIAGVFLSGEAQWGAAEKGGWTHFSITPPASLVFKSNELRTAGQVAAEMRADYTTLVAGLVEFPAEIVKKAVALLGTEALYRSEKCLGVAEWLLELHEKRRAAKTEHRRKAVTWRAVATAPPGFCHVRSTMIGTLLADLAAELPFQVIKDRFAAKMHPLQYQRPTAAPSAQNIARAEKIVAQLKAAGALKRRFARLADIQAIWTPIAPPKDKAEGGVFAHLKARVVEKETVLDAPPTVMTWEKFHRTVLPEAARIKYVVPDSREAYLALVTAKDLDAPPIIQWDSPEKRNPVTPYVYVNGSLPAQWNLRAGQPHPVTAITYTPAMWRDPSSRTHHGQCVIFLLEGAWDSGYRGGAGFFPEFLKHEYHEVRATLEAYAKTYVVEDKEKAEGCGISLSKGGTWNLTFVVTRKDGVTLSYKLDRWD